MHEALTNAGAVITMEQVEKLIADVDDDGTGEIEFEEFCEIMETCLDAVPEYIFKVRPNPPYGHPPPLATPAPARSSSRGSARSWRRASTRCPKASEQGSARLAVWESDAVVGLGGDSDGGVHSNDNSAG